MNHHLVPSQQPSSLGGADRWTYSTPVQPPPIPQDGAPIDIARVLLSLRRRWWLVAICAIAAGAVAWYYVRKQPRVYSARAVVQLVDSRQAIAGGLLKGDADRIPIAYTMLTQVEILRSRAVAMAAVEGDPLGIRVTASGFPNWFISDAALDESVSAGSIPLTFSPSGVSVAANGGEVVPYGQPVIWRGVRFTIREQPAEVTRGSIVVRSRDQAADRVLAGLNVTPRKQTNIIDVVYTAPDPSTAQRVVNRVAQAYQTVNTRLAQQQLRRRRAFIEDQLARTDAQLAEADRALSTFRNRQQAYSSQDKFKAQQAALSGLDVRREELDGDRKMARALLRRFETSNDAGRKTTLSMLAASPEVSGDRSAVPDLYKRLVEYERSRAEMISGPSGRAATHPDVQRLDTLIASTQSELIAASQARVALLDARIEALDEVRSRDASALQQLPFAEAAETRLQQNAEALRAQGATLRTEHQQARIAEAAEVGQIEIVDLATRARVAQVSGRRFIAFVIFLGILGGGALALLLESADRTVKRRDEVESSLHVPVLATIPRIDGDELRKGRYPVLSAMTSSRANHTVRRRGVALTSATQTRSAGAEAFRHLATNLFYSRAGESARRILVTSPTEGDGKTSIAANLAITLAHRRHRVLLVDCDVYGKLHSIFELPISPGVAEVILDRVPPSEVIRPSGVEGLAVMTAGRHAEKTTDVIGSERMRAMLNDMTQEFDLVILDCSPILALADSTILSVNSDAVLLVVRAGHTAAAAAVEAMRHLSTVGARVGGVVINDPDDRTRQYGEYYGYGYVGAGR